MPPSVRQDSKHVPAVADAQQTPLRILAIDYGRRRIGLAISDSLALTARPLATLERKNRRADLERLREICTAHGVTRILVGYPLRLGGESGEMAGEATQFAGRLTKHLGIEVELVDERLTSWEARQTVAETRSSGRSAASRSRKARQADSGRGPLDHVAAAVLLREYLERVHGQASAVSRRTEGP